jgi:hypothetical protein
VYRINGKAAKAPTIGYRTVIIAVVLIITSFMVVANSLPVLNITFILTE